MRSAALEKRLQVIIIIVINTKLEFYLKTKNNNKDETQRNGTKLVGSVGNISQTLIKPRRLEIGQLESFALETFSFSIARFDFWAKTTETRFRHMRRRRGRELLCVCCGCCGCC